MLPASAFTKSGFKRIRKSCTGRFQQNRTSCGIKSVRFFIISNSLAIFRHVTALVLAGIASNDFENGKCRCAVEIAIKRISKRYS